MKDYRISPEAEIDLARILHFIAQDDPIAADGFISQLLAVMAKLQIEPRMAGRATKLLQAFASTHMGTT